MKVSEFNFFVDSFFEGCTLAYNTLTGCFLTLSEDEYRAVRAVLLSVDATGDFGGASESVVRTLTTGGFVVEDDFDERMMVRRRYYEGQAAAKGLTLTVAPTVSCNFACGYCFQEHPKRSMDAEQINAVKDFVQNRLEPGTYLTVGWFGGEPLIAFPTIRELAPWFAELCSQRNCKFSQSIITNGYLLDDNKVDFLAELGNVSYLQITLDGPPEVHDSRRVTRGGGPTFNRILDNIENASRRLPINIRVNVDRTNCGRLEPFVDILAERGLQQRVSVYLGHTLPTTEVCAHVERTALTREEFSLIQVNFNFYLFQKGFPGVALLPEPGYGNLCGADNPNGFVVAPGNLFFKCWNEVTMDASHASGQVRAMGKKTIPIMERNRRAWEDYDPFTHEPCRTCKVQPLCRGGCPWEAMKNGKFDPGHRTPARFNLPDRLRLYHLEQSVQRCIGESVRASETACP